MTDGAVTFLASLVGSFVGSFVFHAGRLAVLRAHYWQLARQLRRRPPAPPLMHVLRPGTTNSAWCGVQCWIGVNAVVLPTPSGEWSAANVCVDCLRLQYEASDAAHVPPESDCG